MAHGPPTRGEARTCQPVVRRVGRVKCVAVFSARVWEREAFKADRADLDALASRGWHGGGAGGRRARLWDRSTALRPSTRASMARTTDWTLTQRGIAEGRSLQGPAGHQGHGGPIPGRAAHRPDPHTVWPPPCLPRSATHAGGAPTQAPIQAQAIRRSFEIVRFPNEQWASRRKSLANSARLAACVRSSLLYRRPAPRSRCVYHRLHPPARNGATRDLLRVCLRCRHQRSEPRKSGPHLQWLWTWHRPIRTCAA